ncbi:PREDICTED: mitochondrial inner membrane protein OXA1-like isoform X2 [Tarenaya hassleriana]|uniref:mitochondrial inner membrane protein OXA1-like isoform X2 n=1 Tax=Tarenaya hassleriana TaxID=28532 RepID=UPI00053C41F0|nr:PREDICTED: mitochondrial inner membrane protein OXA1-like isoform X2 [Tarenaya hassleriana]
MACLHSISRRRTNLLPRQFWMPERPVLRVNNDYTRTYCLNSSPLACGMHSQARRLDLLLEERKHMSFARPLGSGFLLCRHMSSKPGECSDKIDYLSTVVEELVPEESLEAVIPQVSSVKEVAIAAADSSLPVAAIQHFIDSVHAFTGFNWCASIVISTFLVGGLYIPTRVILWKNIPHIVNICQRVRKMAETDGLVTGEKEWEAIFEEFEPFLSSLLIASLAEGFIYVSTFLAIHNMAQKMPSFQSGGILWFTDLTTPDRFYILPVVTGLTFWFTGRPLSRQHNPVGGTRILLWVIFTSVAFQAIFSFESALYCFMIPSRVFLYGASLDCYSSILASKYNTFTKAMLSGLLKILQRLQSRKEQQYATKKKDNK